MVAGRIVPPPVAWGEHVSPRFTVQAMPRIRLYSHPFTETTLWFRRLAHHKLRDGREKPMLWTIFVLLLILWLLGFSFHVAGSLIHLLLVIALVVLIFNIITGRRSAV